MMTKNVLVLCLGWGIFRGRMVAACDCRARRGKIHAPASRDRENAGDPTGRTRPAGRPRQRYFHRHGRRPTWADDYQMDQILLLPELTSLVVEGPGITNQLVPRIVEQPNLASLTLKNTLVDDEGIAQLVDLKTLKVVELRVSPLISDRAMESSSSCPSSGPFAWSAAISPTGASLPCSGAETL